MMRKNSRRNDNEDHTHVFEAIRDNASDSEKSDFHRKARQEVFRMSREAAATLAENDQPFAMVISSKTKNTIHIGMAGSREDAIKLYETLHQTLHELKTNIIAAELGLTPDKVEKFRELIEGEE